MAGLAIGVLHVVARPKSKSGAQTAGASALMDLEPRGGRHRFSLRHFEVALLLSLWWTALGALLLFVPQSRSLSPRALTVLGTSLVAVLFASWWLWRRGALRSPASSDEDET